MVNLIRLVVTRAHRIFLVEPRAVCLLMLGNAGQCALALCASLDHFVYPDLAQSLRVKALGKSHYESFAFRVEHFVMIEPDAS